MHRPKIKFAIALLMALPAAAQTSQDIDKRVDDLLVKMTLEEKIDLLGGVDAFYLPGVPHLNIPRMKMSDGPFGARNDGPSTTMVAGIGLAASWNPELASEVGREIGRDARARGVHFMLGPGVNIFVAPQNGRNFEYFGEDPLLAGRMAVGYIRGMQSQGVSATVKHFMGNNSEFLRHGVDSIIDERTMRELYLPAFETAVKDGHVGAIMDSYNLVNGEHMSQNGHLNNDIAKKDWGFDGVMMSDWLATYDGVAAANGGLDAEMPSGANLNRKVLLPAIETGKVKVATIDDKVRRILRTGIRLGWMDRVQVDLSIPRDNPQGKQVALEAARQGVVLLKNAGDLLPLKASQIKTLAIIGPNAYPATPVGGGSAEVKPFAAVSFLQGLSDKLGTAASVTYDRGVGTWSQFANKTNFTTTESGGTAGLTVERFNNADVSGSPVSTKIEHHINEKPPLSLQDLLEMDMADLDPAMFEVRKGTSSRWTGFYTAKTSGKYEIFAQAPNDGGGGYRLFVDGKLVLDDWEVRKANIDQAAVTLTAGAHKVVFEQCQFGQDFFAGLLRVGIAADSEIVAPQAKALAAAADVVVVAAGYDDSSESEGGDRTFGLPFGQDELIREMAAVNKKVIVVVTAGGSVDTSGWLDRVAGLLHVWYPGQEGGTALAEVLMGDVNPSGRLPISYDRAWADNPAHESYYPEPGTHRAVYKDGIFVGYRGYDHSGKQPLFPFGFGLSYTSFQYSNLNIQASNDGYDVSFEVANTGTRAGADVAQVYVGDTHAPVPRPPQELKGFERVLLQPGEKKTVKIALTPRSFAYFDVAGSQWRADAGDFAIAVGRSEKQIELTGKVTLKTVITIPR